MWSSMKSNKHALSTCRCLCAGQCGITIWYYYVVSLFNPGLSDLSWGNIKLEVLVQAISIHVVSVTMCSIHHTTGILHAFAKIWLTFYVVYTPNLHIWDVYEQNVFNHNHHTHAPVLYYYTKSRDMPRFTVHTDGNAACINLINSMPSMSRMHLNNHLA